MLHQQVISFKQVNLQIHNDERYGSCLTLQIDGVPVKEKEKGQDVSQHVVSMVEQAGARNADGYTDGTHRVGKIQFAK